MLRKIKFDFLHWVADSKMLDRIEETMVYSKFKVISKLGLRFWNWRTF